MINYKQKYLKYKLKYQQLLKQKGGMETDGLSEQRKKEILNYFEKLIPKKIKTLNKIEFLLNNDPNLVELDLSNNIINSASAINLADALKYNTTLKLLGLESCNIDSIGAVALAEALKVNDTLEILELNTNNIGSTGGLALAEALKVNNTLNYLNLNYTNIDNDVANEFLKTLKVNKTLRYLYFNNTKIDDVKKEELIIKVDENLKNFEVKKEEEKKGKQIEYLSILQPPQVSPDLPERGVGLFIVGKEPGHESSAYGTCYILKSRLGVERCEFIYTERPTIKGERITGGSENLELLIQLEEKLINLIENRYTHLYLFMECHGGTRGYCSHKLNEGGAFTINLLIKTWKKYYDSWKSAIFICDSCASNLLIEEAKLPYVNAKNIIGFGIPGQCEEDISKAQLRIIKAITFSAIHSLILNPLMDIKTFLDSLKTTWDEWRDANLKSTNNYYTMEIFYSNLDESEVSLKICNPQNLNISGDYKPLAYGNENQLGPNNSAFNAGWKALIFWWLTTPFNDINNIEELMIQEYILDKYRQGDNIKIWYSGEESLITTAREMAISPNIRNKIKLLETLRDESLKSKITRSNDDIKIAVTKWYKDNSDDKIDSISKYGHISDWDVSNVTNMKDLFYFSNYEDNYFNEDISNWNVKNVNNMQGMFFNAEYFNQDITKWNVSNVTNMAHMFDSATSFNQDISKWDVSNVINMEYMFDDATSFNKNLNVWNVTSQTNMSGMFNNSPLENAPPIWYNTSQQ